MRDISKGINSMLEAVISPFNMAASYVERNLSKGVIPAEITGELSR